MPPIKILFERTRKKNRTFWFKFWLQIDWSCWIAWNFIARKKKRNLCLRYWLKSIEWENAHDKNILVSIQHQYSVFQIHECFSFYFNDWFLIFAFFRHLRWYFGRGFWLHFIRYLLNLEIQLWYFVFFSPSQLRSLLLRGCFLWVVYLIVDFSISFRKYFFFSSLYSPIFYDEFLFQQAHCK